MPSGLFALLDDVAVLARATATSLDDVVLGAAKASSKSAGVLVDDAVVTPGMIRGLDPKRELPVVWKITLGSLRNKFLIMLPLILLLSAFAPWVFPYLLILGGGYLVYEGAEKVLQWFGFHSHAHSEKGLEAAGNSAEAEKRMIGSAVRTDLVLSAEVMLISLAALEIGDNNWISQAVALGVIALLMTVIVYGAVAVLVKLDDVGLYLGLKEGRFAKLFGLGLVKAMPFVFKLLSVVGTVAMLWVGGHLLWKSLGDVGISFASSTLHTLEDFLHHFGGFVAWVGDTAASAIVGLALGLLIVAVVTPLKKAFKKRRKV